MRALSIVVSISVLAGASLFALAQSAQPPAPAQPVASGIDAKQISQLDLGPELEGLKGKRLLMRTVTFPPGSRSPEHNHQGKPGLVYVLQGTFTEHRNGVATEYGPGSSWIEDHDTTHWVENRGSVPAVQLSVAIDALPAAKP
ncbi:MAG: cupin domain-containing protein [Pseudomonadota bacterium]